MGELLTHEPLTDRQAGFVHDIVISAQSLLGIINDILDFSKIETGKLELNPVDYDFNMLIDNVESMFMYVAQKKGLEFKLECGEDLPSYLYGDDIRLRQILTNICGNAVKFTEKGHVKLTVKANAGNLVFTVEDTGMGIRREDLLKLFNAFEQVDKSKNRNVVGTGLGLSISKSFVTAMGGNITVESEYGYGTSFTITIPIVAGDPQNAVLHGVNSTGQSLSAPEARILVTDDNEFNLKVASGLLSLMDIEAETADSGYKAIDLVKEKDYDIVFMDHMMPEINGIETVERIRALGGKYNDLTIIALTANAIKGAAEMFLASGFDGFIAKPINVEELRTVIKKYLPPEKLQEVDESKHRSNFHKEDELLIKAKSTFVKDNRNTFKAITDALDSGDIKTAHRIAHTLKSSAAYLKKKKLAAAAASLEASLAAESAEYTPEQLQEIETELASALLEFEPLAKKEDSTAAVQVSIDDLVIIFTQLKPLLEKGDFAAADYIEMLQGIAGMEDLAERIDEYDFVGALEVLERFN
jgi:CheY-like chemotaxis protein